MPYFLSVIYRLPFLGNYIITETRSLSYLFESIMNQILFFWNYSYFWLSIWTNKSLFRRNKQVRQTQWTISARLCSGNIQGSSRCWEDWMECKWDAIPRNFFQAPWVWHQNLKWWHLKCKRSSHKGPPKMQRFIGRLWKVVPLCRNWAIGRTHTIKFRK